MTAVELSGLRAAYARDLVGDVPPGTGTLRVVEDDFMTVDLGPARFDVVVVWNGFGIGDDAFQRAQLARVAGTWLAPGGAVVLDVFNPTAWARWAGEEEVDEETGLRQRVDFDAVAGRFVDSWWFDGPEAPPLQQDVRCYTPADLRLLLEPTGLVLDALHHPGEDRLVSGSWGVAWGYRVVLRLG